MSGSNKKNPLGRGLEALLGNDTYDFEADTEEFTPAKNSVFKTEDTLKINIEQIERCSFQPRTEFNEENLKDLSESIKEKGILQPILVRQKAEKYEIIAGERRWRAAKLAGLTQVPVIIKNLNNRETLEIALIENIQRENLSPIEEAKGLSKLISDYSYTQEAIGKIISKSRSYIANTLRLLNLPAEVQAMVAENKLSAGHARALVGLPNAAELAQKIIEKELNVRDTEELASTARKKKQPKKIQTDAELKNIEFELNQKLRLKVKISAGKKGNGSVTLHYENPAELSRILDILEQR
ncbi:MAG: ParB/RepB/Spo0J family partition protein [Alphaproteobacteria bacterium]|nr:ParB/RepB/Spo0J family partition protein [Alphaproteobacteria bacterium]